jgi:protein-S-isoprenylcysteine O-methyltransferase Ste14
MEQRLVMMSIFLLVLAIALWGMVHSLLASLPVKAVFLRGAGPNGMRLYRLGFNFFSVISFLPIIWLWLTLPDRPLYHVPPPWSYMMIAGQGLGMLLLFISVMQTDLLAFVGLRQLLEENQRGALVTGGLYRWVRHPIYSASLLVLWLTPSVSLITFVFYLCLSAYFLVGAWFEERKLLREFGQAYAEYRQATPMLIPGLKIGK